MRTPVTRTALTALLLAAGGTGCFRADMDWVTGELSSYSLKESSYSLATLPAGSRVVMTGPASAVQEGACFELRAQLLDAQGQPFHLDQDVSIRFSASGPDQPEMDEFADPGCAVSVADPGGGGGGLTKTLLAGQSAYTLYFSATGTFTTTILAQVTGVPGSVGHLLAGIGAPAVDPLTQISLLAGPLSSSGYQDGAASSARFARLDGIVAKWAAGSGSDGALHVYVMDSGNRRIRKVTQTVAGGTSSVSVSSLTAADGIRDGSAMLQEPGTEAPIGKLLVADRCSIKEVDQRTGAVTNLAGGTYDCSAVDGAPGTGRLMPIRSMAAIGGHLYLLTEGDGLRRMDLAQASRGALATLSFTAGPLTGITQIAKLGVEPGAALLIFRQPGNGAGSVDALALAPGNPPVSGLSLIPAGTISNGHLGALAVDQARERIYAFNGRSLLAIQFSAGMVLSETSSPYLPLGDADGYLTGSYPGTASLGDFIPAAAYEPSLQRMVFSDTSTHLVRELDVSGSTLASARVTTLAGTPGLAGYFNAGVGAGLRLGVVQGMASMNGAVYAINSTENTVVRYSRQSGSVTGTEIAGQSAALAQTAAIAVDGADSVYVAHNNYGVFSEVIRFAGGVGTPVHSNGGGASVYEGLAVERTAAGTPASFLFFSDSAQNTVHRLSLANNALTTYGVLGAPGWTDGTALGSPSVARFRRPTALCLAPANDTLYVLVSDDQGNGAIRAIDLASGDVTTLAGGSASRGNPGDTGPGTSVRMDWTRSITCDEDYVYLVRNNDSGLRRVSRSTGVVSYVPGARNLGGQDVDGSFGPGQSGSFGGLRQVATDGNGGLYVSNLFNIRWLR